MSWLTGWSKRKKITLTGGSSGAQNLYQLKLTVAYDSDMQSDFDDLRFTKADGITLIDAWLESKTDDTSAVVWVEFPTTPANTVTEDYYMYYGNTVASNWDGAATFPSFFDDFEGSSMGANWVHSRAFGTTTVANSIVHLDGPTNEWNFWQASNATFIPLPATVHFRVKQDESSSNSGEVFGLGLADNMWEGTDNIYMGNNGTPGKLYKTTNEGTITSNARTSSYTNYTIVEARWKSGQVDYYEDGVHKDTITTNVPDESLVPFLGVSQVVGQQWIDWIFVCKYTTNPATYVFGNEQSSGNPYWYYNLLKRRN